MIRAELIQASTLGLEMRSQTRVSLDNRFDSETTIKSIENPKEQLLEIIKKNEIAESKLVAVLEKRSVNRECTHELLRSLGYTPVGFELSEDLITLLRRGTRFDLLLASFDGDGSQVADDVRALKLAAGSTVPLLLMVREAQLHIVAASAYTANVDFILAPCNPLELEARFAALQRSISSDELDEGFRCGSYYFNPRGRKVDLFGKEVKLQPREFDLACRFFRNPGYIHARKALFRSVWGRDRSDDETRTLDVHVARLRKKLDLGPHSECELLSIYSVGYQLKIHPPGDDGSANEK